MNEETLLNLKKITRRIVVKGSNSVLDNWLYYFSLLAYSG